MRLVNVLAVLLIVQLGLTFSLFHRVKEASNAVGGLLEQGTVPVVYEVGYSQGDLVAIMGRSKLTPDFVEGFFAARGWGDLQIKTAFLRNRGVWNLSVDFRGTVFKAEGIVLSSACFDLLGEIHESQGIPANE